MAADQVDLVNFQNSNVTYTSVLARENQFSV